MITEKNHKLLTSQLFVTDCTKKGLASMGPERLEISGKRGVVLMPRGWTGAHAVDVVAKRLKTRLY